MKLFLSHFLLRRTSRGKWTFSCWWTRNKGNREKFATKIFFVNIISFMVYKNSSPIIVFMFLVCQQQRKKKNKVFTSVVLFLWGMDFREVYVNINIVKINYHEKKNLFRIMLKFVSSWIRLTILLAVTKNLIKTRSKTFRLIFHSCKLLNLLNFLLQSLLTPIKRDWNFCNYIFTGKLILWFFGFTFN